MSIDAMKISKLTPLTRVPESGVVPVALESKELTYGSSLFSLRASLFFENAYSTVGEGIDGTDSGEVFFVYTTEEKKFVGGYLNAGGSGATSLLNLAGQQVTYPTYLSLLEGGSNSFIPWVYNEGSAVGGETSFVIDTPIVDVAELYLGSERQHKGYQYTYNTVTQTVTLGSPLEQGEFVIAYVRPLNGVDTATPDVENFVNFSWVYNNGSAVGGETKLTPPYTFRTIPAIYLNGSRQVLGKHYEITPDGLSVNLATSLVATDFVQVILGGELAEVIADFSGTAAEVYAKLAETTGAGLIKTTSGKTVQGEFDALHGMKGWETVGVRGGTLRDFTKKTTHSILEYLTDADYTTITTQSGVEVTVDYALQALLADGHITAFYPGVLGIYVHGATLVTLPTGFTMIGEASLPYNPWSDAMFIGYGTVIRKATGATGIFQQGHRNNFEKIVFDGRDRLTSLQIGPSTDHLDGNFFNACGMYRWYAGVGKETYSAGVVTLNCAIAQNTIGWYNTIDSKSQGTTINANIQQGIRLRTGANNNCFYGTRVEWNGSENILVDSAKGNLFANELIDRAGLAGVAAINGGVIVITNAMIQRSGKSAAAGANNNTNLYLEGDGSMIYMTGVRTTIGVNDDGTGNSTPENMLTTSGASTNMYFVASGCDLTGYTTGSYIRVITQALLNVSGCPGFPDTCNTGLTQVTNGIRHIGPANRSKVLAATVGSTVVLTFNQPGITQYSTAIKRSLSLMTRKVTGNGEEYYTLPLLFSREFANAVVRTNADKSESYPTGVYALTSGTGVNVSMVVSSDASTLTVTLTNVDGAERRIDGFLL